MADRPHARALIDTSIVVDLDQIPATDLPDTMAISALTLAELAAGPHAATEAHERARRQELLQRVEATFDLLPFDADAARAFGRLYPAVAALGRKARGRRAVDLMIAATALAAELPLYTRNPDDFEGLQDLVEVKAVPPT